MAWAVIAGDGKTDHGLYGATAQLVQSSAGPSGASSPLSWVPSLQLPLTPVEVGLRGCSPHLGESVGRRVSSTVLSFPFPARHGDMSSQGKGL